MKLNPGDATLAMQANDSQDLVRRKMEMDELRKRFSGEKDQKAKLREACEGFESIFIQRMWEQMRKNVPKEGYLHSKDEHMYQAMYDQEFARKMASAGGIGLADMLYEQLAQRQGDSSRTVSPSVDTRLPIIPAGSSPSGARFNPDAQPLKPIREEREGIPLDRKRHEVAARAPMPELNNNPFGPKSVTASATEPAAGKTEGPRASVPGNAERESDAPMESAVPVETSGGMVEDINMEYYSQAMLEAELEGRETPPLPDQAAVQAVNIMTEEEAAVLQAAINLAAMQAQNFTSPPTPPAQAAASAIPLSPQAAAAPEFLNPGGAGVAETGDPALPQGLAARRRVSSPLEDSPSTSIRDRRPLSPPPHTRPVPGTVVSSFGWRTEEGRRVWHQGLDLDAAPGDPVFASLDGRVSFAGEREGYGRLVIVEHEGGWRTFYGNAALDGLKVGDPVQAGTEFAKVTAQPENSSPHLHFEMRRGELAVNPDGSGLRMAQRTR